MTTCLYWECLRKQALEKLALSETGRELITQQYRQISEGEPAFGQNITLDDMITAIIHHELRETHSVL